MQNFFNNLATVTFGIGMLGVFFTPYYMRTFRKQDQKVIYSFIFLMFTLTPLAKGLALIDGNIVDAFNQGEWAYLTVAGVGSVLSLIALFVLVKQVMNLFEKRSKQKALDQQRENRDFKIIVRDNSDFNHKKQVKTTSTKSKPKSTGKPTPKAHKNITIKKPKKIISLNDYAYKDK